MDFKEKVEAKISSYTGEHVAQQLRNAYKQGMEDLANELNKRFEEEALNANNDGDDTQAGLFRAIGILSEYGN
jgi:predicted ATPase